MKPKLLLLPIILVLINTAHARQHTSSSNQTTNMQTASMKTDSTSGYVDVNGLHLYYEIHGEGAPLVLLHGGGSTNGSTCRRLSQQHGRRKSASYW
ncbi:alpha/beta fold hydrolase [Deminuibacter soli]|uniref:alpha/beta fold hydrolase n=1 Tax=Deminuibacter soli TaxID=2291815 RepID=UPI001B880F42|nr:hypothetical protein [Deminuibacter soli]